jgi:type VI secretion system protein ImpH
MPGVIDLLRERPHGFDLFQALSLLERAQGDREPIGTSVGLDEAVRLAAQVDLAFAASDINGVEESKRHGPPLTLRTSALSLAGAHGPLPMPFTELLLERRRAGDRAGLEFLDIFNQRLLAFLYRGRRKHHLALDARGAEDDVALLRALDALSGLGRAEGARGPNGERAWLRHAGLQGAAPRSMASLIALLRDRLGVRFEGRQFVGAWHALAHAERATLSGRRRVGTRLGDGGSLGHRAWDQEAGIELRTPALAHQRFAALLPGGRAHGMLGWLVNRHLQRETQVIVRLAIAQPPASKLDPCALLAPRLGLSAWLSSPPRPAGASPDARWAPQPPRFVLQSAPAAPTERTPVHGN